MSRVDKVELAVQHHSFKKKNDMIVLMVVTLVVSS